MKGTKSNIDVIVAAKFIDNATKVLGEKVRTWKTYANEAEQRFSKLGSSLLKFSTIPMASAVLTTKNFSEAVGQLRGRLSMTDDEIANLVTQAKELGASTIYTNTQIINAQAELAASGKNIQEIYTIIPRLLKFAQANSIGLAEASVIVTDGMNSMGLGLDQLNRYLDVTTTAVSNSSQNMSTFQASLSKTATSANLVGISIEEVSSFIGILANNGMKAEIAGTRLKTMFEVLSKPATLKKLKAMGFSLDLTKDGKIKDGIGLIKQLNTVFDKKKGIQKLGLIEGIFGSEPTTVLGILSKNTDKLVDFVNVLHSAQGSLDRKSDLVNQGFFKGITELTSGVSGFFTFDGKSGEALTSLVNTIKGFVEYINNSPELRDIFRGLIIGGTVLGTVLLGSSVGMKAFRVIAAESVSIVRLLGTAFSFLAGKAGGIGLIITLIVGALTDLGKTGKVIESIFKGLLEGIWTGIKGIGEVIHYLVNELGILGENIFNLLPDSLIPDNILDNIRRRRIADLRSAEEIDKSSNKPMTSERIARVKEISNLSKLSSDYSKTQLPRAQSLLGMGANDFRNRVASNPLLLSKSNNQSNAINSSPIFNIVVNNTGDQSRSTTVANASFIANKVSEKLNYSTKDITNYINASGGLKE